MKLARLLVVVLLLSSCEDSEPEVPVLDQDYDLIFFGTIDGVNHIISAGASPDSYKILLESVDINNPKPSPDGSKILFTRNVSTNSDIYVVNRDGSGLLQLTSEPGLDNDPSWSPDGTKIVFASDRESSRDIWIMNADGSSPVNITPDPTFSTECCAAWSPSGNRIAYRSTEDGGFDLWVMDPDGTNRQNLTTSTEDVARDPSWSPDGTKIVFRLTKPQTPEDEVNIAIVAANGGDITIVEMENFQWHPVFWPDGSRIVYTNYDLTNFRSDIYSMAIDGSDVQLISGESIENISWPGFLKK